MKYLPYGEHLVKIGSADPEIICVKKRNDRVYNLTFLKSGITGSKFIEFLYDVAISSQINNLKSL